jgi:ATP-binding cassette subfamily B protein
MTGLSMLAMVATVWFGGWQITQGRMEIGELTSFMLYLTILQLPVRAIGWPLGRTVGLIARRPR